MGEVLNISTGLCCIVVLSTESATKDALSCCGQPNICMIQIRIYFILIQQQQTLLYFGFKWFEIISCLLSAGEAAYRASK